MDAKKIAIWLGVGVLAVIVYKKFIKKEEPFAVAETSGEMQQRPMQKA